MEYNYKICNVRLLLVSCVLLILTTKGHCEFEVELSSGYKGVVIVKNYNGTVGGVCQKGWCFNSCVVICRQLNYSGGIPNDHVYQQYSIKLDRYLLANVVCTGDERRLSDCHYDTDTHVCDLVMHQAACSCDEPNGKIISPPALEHPKVKLSLGFHGVVEVTRYGDTRLVCNTHWTDTECKVVCKQIGYSGGSPAIKYYPTKIENVWMDNVVCSGTEETLDQCQHGLWGHYYCIPSDDKATCKCDKDLEVSSAYPTKQPIDSSHTWRITVLMTIFFILLAIFIIVVCCSMKYHKIADGFNPENSNSLKQPLVPKRDTQIICQENIINENIQFEEEERIDVTQEQFATNHENEANEVKETKLVESNGPDYNNKPYESTPSNISSALPYEHQRSHVNDTTKNTKTVGEENVTGQNNIGTQTSLVNPEARDCYTYKGSDNLKGLAIIINIMEFQNLKYREFSELDAGKLRTMWMDAGFDHVRRYDNPTETILHSEIIRDAQDDLRKGKYGCFVCCILSHGKLDFIHTSDDSPVPIKEEILSPFRAKKLPEFAGYPKIFLLQSCRLDEDKPPTKLSESYLTRCEVNVKQSLPYSSKEDSTVYPKDEHNSDMSVIVNGYKFDGEDPTQNIKIPADFFIGYSCSRGESAFRDKDMKGSIYFVCLFQHVQEKAKSHADINWESLMDDFQKEFSENCKRQCPIYVSSLRKEFRLKLQ